MRFLGHRTYLADNLSHGLQRMDLLQTIGPELTRTIITRSGFVRGWLVAERIKRQLPDVWAEARNGELGPMLCSMYGFGDVISSKRTDGLGSAPLVETQFVGSYEAEQHLKLAGKSERSVCWEQVGFASGYVSHIENRTVYFIESQCQAKGDNCCQLTGNYLEQWGDEINTSLKFFAGLTIEKMNSENLFNIDLEELACNEEIVLTSDKKNNQAKGTYSLTKNFEMQKLIDMAINVADVPTSVMVTGESGVGKENIVNLIHNNSSRGEQKLLSINCGAFTDTLLDSELFGHVKGAFTGAEKSRVGLFEAANSGTLFLDEVGELSPAMQVKLLRVLQEQEIRRVGDNCNRKIDVRIISATNKDLEAAVNEGTFRQDLYYRLKVIELKIPPLRVRHEDILIISRQFLTRFTKKMNKEITGIHFETAQMLLGYSWPGNIRELENTIERAVVLSNGPQIMPEDLPEELRFSTLKPENKSTISSLNDVEEKHITSTLALLNNNKMLTAKKLGISVATLYRKLKEYNLNIETN
ncbi:sigma 54-interacting transcriptional regulator [Shewanella atlantica]|uniref:sigma 54-interacting transcriptional regulator n=1 Tax=Shewanella atlantica TaxID=271099 RepID=UPI003736F4FD